MAFDFDLTDEQEAFINKALKGNNVLVDACIGSGKTTAIQALCDRFDKSLSILYLTYNKLLKIDARSKIHNNNVIVDNYHAFANDCLRTIGIHVGVDDMIPTFNHLRPDTGHIDIMVIDEYQDIQSDIADMLNEILSQNPDCQIVAVGDMKQKISNRTSLDVWQFINDFMGEGHFIMKFTKSFRLSPSYAKDIGYMWDKDIKGLNPDCKIRYARNVFEAINYIAALDPGDFMCLGATWGGMQYALNQLEEQYPEKFNKNTVYASIAGYNDIEPDKESAIFTSYDKSKGMERDILIVFDWTYDYWVSRSDKPGVNTDIIRNIFLVAATRGKKMVMFVPQYKKQKGNIPVMTRDTFPKNEIHKVPMKNVDISKMFAYQNNDDLDKCYSFIKKKKLRADDASVINIRTNDGFIDLSPCIDIYQEAAYFDNYNIMREFDFINNLNRSDNPVDYDYINEHPDLEERICYLVSLKTSQNRYKNQIDLPLVNDKHSTEIMERLSARIDKDADVQIECYIPFGKLDPKYRTNDGTYRPYFFAKGIADAVIDNTVYDFKFVKELGHEDFLQCAAYMIALNCNKGILWNIRDNSIYSVSIRDKEGFMDAVTACITHHELTYYFNPYDIKDIQWNEADNNDNSEELVI